MVHNDEYRVAGGWERVVPYDENIGQEGGIILSNIISVEDSSVREFVHDNECRGLLCGMVLFMMMYVKDRSAG